MEPPEIGAKNTAKYYIFAAHLSDYQTNAEPMRPVVANGDNLPTTRQQPAKTCHPAERSTLQNLTFCAGPGK